MPGLGVHYSVALLFVLSLSKLRNWSWRHIFLLSPLAVLPDLDAFHGLHGLLHTSLILTIPLFLYYYLKEERQRQLVLVGVLFYSSHIFLDLFHHGVPLFFPLLPYSFHPSMEIMYQGRLVFEPKISVGVSEFSYGTAIGYPAISALGASLLVLSAAVFLSHLWRGKS